MAKRGPEGRGQGGEMLKHVWELVWEGAREGSEGGVRGTGARDGCEVGVRGRVRKKGCEERCAKGDRGES